MVAANLDLLFTGMEIISAYPFRVIRDADVEIEEDEAADLLTAVEEGVGLRYFGSAVRLEVDDHMPERIRNLLMENLDLAPFQVYTVHGPIGLSDLMELTDIERPDLKHSSLRACCTCRTHWRGEHFQRHPPPRSSAVSPLR